MARHTLYFLDTPGGPRAMVALYDWSKKDRHYDFTAARPTTSGGVITYKHWHDLTPEEQATVRRRFASERTATKLTLAGKNRFPPAKKTAARKSGKVKRAPARKKARRPARKTAARRKSGKKRR